MERKLFNFYVLLIPLIVLFGLLTDHPLISFLIIVGVFFVIFPIIDAFSGQDPIYPYDVISTQHNEAIVFAGNPNLDVLYLTVLLQFVVIGTGLYKVSQEGARWLPFALL